MVLTVGDRGEVLLADLALTRILGGSTRPRGLVSTRLRSRLRSKALGRTARPSSLLVEGV